MEFNQVVKRWGWAGIILGGLVWISFHIWYMRIGSQFDSEIIAGYVWIAGLAVLLSAVGVYAIYLSAQGRLTKGSLLILAAGMTIFATGAMLTSAIGGAAWLISIMGEMVTFIGLFLFGLINLSEKLLGKLHWLPLIMAPLYWLSFGSDPGEYSIPIENWTEWLAVVYGLGWMLIGIWLFNHKKSVTT